MKITIFVTFMLFSLNAFCCKPESKMEGETFFNTGILNKLKSEARFDDFEIKLIAKKDLITKLVRIENSSEQKCIELLMHPYGQGSCYSFTADIESENEVKFADCSI